MDLFELGWGPPFEEAFARLRDADWEPARVLAAHRGGYRVGMTRGDWTAEVAGRLRHESAESADFPAVGDWVAVQALPSESKAIIHAVLPRRTKFSRAAPGGRGEEQVLAANMDDVFVVAALDSRLNMRRLERFLSLAWESGADPVIVLTKADLCDAVDSMVREVERTIRNVPVCAVSGTTGQGMDVLESWLRPGRTMVLLGPSGVGKSTLINRWCGAELLPVQEVRESDHKGRHTTTHRQLVRLPSGALVMDTPGMRELQLWEGESGVGEVFADIEALALQCRFANCRHESEPGCAVAAAVQSGALDAARLESQRKLASELAYFERRHNKRAEAEEKRRIKSMHRAMRSIQKARLRLSRGGDGGKNA